MADPFYTPNIPPVSSTHKRSYDAMDPELDGRPAGTTRRNPSLASSSSSSGSRERNKRPRNNSESEVDDILVSSSTSMSSSGSSSSSSIESYHSARSSFTDISPPLLPADEASVGQLPLMDVPATLLEQIEEADVPMADVSMDDVLSFVTRQDPIAPPPALAPPPATDPNEEMRRAMERVDAFEREMSVLRQSRADPPPRWTPFNPGMEGFGADETSFNDLGSFTADPFFPQALLPLARGTEQPDEPRPRLSADRDSLDDRLRRLETLERDAALPSNVIRRSRAHREFLDRLVDPILTLGELEPPPSHQSSYHRFPSHQRVQPPTGMANPQTRPPQNRRPSPIPSRSTRSSELAAFLADDYLRRDRDREIETELEDAIRDAEAHRQRVAQFLSEGPSRSSFSTLRGALDDGSVGDRTHPPSTRRGGRLPGRTQPPNPPQVNRPPLWERISEPAVSTVETTPWTPWESALLDMNPFSDLNIISRSATSSQRAGDELPLFSPPLPSRRATTFAEYTSTWTRGGSYLETNSRARSHGLSNLRHRARPTRSPSPAPSPPSPGPLLTPASLFDPPALGSIPLADRSLPPRSHRNHPAAFAPRTSTDDAMLQSFNESIPSSVIPPPSPVFYSAPLADIPPPPPEPAPQSRPYGSFDLEAYRAGPFRATLARSMALRGQNRTVRDRGVAVDERRLRDVLGAISDSEDDEDDQDLLDLLPYALGHNRVREEHNRRRETLNRMARPRVAPPNPPTTSRTSQTPTSDASRGLEDRHFLPMSIAERRLASIRPVSRSQDQTDRLRELLARPTVPPTARHRTIPERERSISNLREPPDNQPSARSSGLDRWEQRRDTIRRMTTRRTSGPDLPPSRTTPSLPPRLLGNIHEGPPPSMPSVRQRPGPRLMAYRPPSPPTSTYSTAGRGEPRAPLNGRFARSRGFPPHIPPDMVWVDFPTSRFPPSGRRRNFGDYVRDEDLDTSYEGLLSLSTLLGDVKPRGTPADIVSALPRGTYGEWVRPGQTEERCPICLDDYEAKDACLRVPTCSHWFHEGCLQQWLKGARTCPVCRGRVTKPVPAENPAPVAGPSGSNSRNNEREDDDDSDSELDLRHWIPSFPPWRRD
ncbi:hypothetical protein LXA43DRAFT_720705 [Ganoderma leucocontextum]|nr:hypothetical protein LXA43DRAFT_720705 [Ganoderma leucocontextum]